MNTEIIKKFREEQKLRNVYLHTMMDEKNWKQTKLGEWYRQKSSRTENLENIYENKKLNLLINEKVSHNKYQSYQYNEYEVYLGSLCITENDTIRIWRWEWDDIRDRDIDFDDKDWWKEGLKHVLYKSLGKINGYDKNVEIEIERLKKCLEDETNKIKKFNKLKTIKN